MTWKLRFVLIIFILVSVSCANDSGTPQSSISNPTSTPALSNPGISTGITATGVVVPVRENKLSFNIAGPVEDVLITTGERVIAGQTLVVLNVPDLEYSVVSADAVLRSALSYAQLQRFRRTVLNQKGKTLYLTGPHEVLEVADAKVAVAQAGLDKAKAEFQQASLTAPFDGTVVELNATIGQFIPANQIVLTFADLTEFEIETTDLNELDVPLIEEGQEVNVTVDALEVDLPGKVSRISPRAEIIDGEVVYKIIIRLLQQPADLRWGMKALVHFD